MMQLKGIKRGKTIELLEEVDIPDGQEVFVEIQEIQITSVGKAEEMPVSLENQLHHSLFGSDQGLIWISDDFDEPLPEFQEYIE
jgi:hypothetical protein